MAQAMKSAAAIDSAEIDAASTQGMISRAPSGIVDEEAKRVRTKGPGVNWQVKLLPLMGGMLVALTAFFFVASFVQLYYLQTRIERGPQLDLAPAMVASADFEANLKRGAAFDRAQFDGAFQYIRWKTLVLLEANALQQRYHEAGVLLISRIWTRYLGFVTGMILALVGAVFILGKLHESNSKLETEGPLWKVSLTTASPGLILAALGTILMVATLATRLEIQVNDGPVFLPQLYAGQSEPPPQPLLPEQNTRPPSDTEILNKMKKQESSKK